MTALTNHAEAWPTEGDLARALLDSYGRNAMDALRSVIADATSRHEDVRTAPGSIGSGVASGWTPKFQRGD